MAFKRYKEIGEVAQKLDLILTSENFVKPSKIAVPKHLEQDLDYVIKNMPYKASEAAICELIIAPILKEVWKNFDKSLTLWSHKAIRFSKELGGIPDYIIAKRSHRGVVVFEKPILAVIEAKKDDFDGGWGQCATEMLTIQRINANSQIPVYGIVSNGENWEFGKLVQNQLIKNLTPYSLADLSQLFAAINFSLQECVHTVNQLIKYEKQ